MKAVKGAIGIGVVAIALVYGLYALQKNTETKVINSISTALSQEIDYTLQDTDYFADTLSLSDISLSHLDHPEVDSATAKTVNISVSYSDALRRNVQIHAVNASHVTLYLTYQAAGMSNFHEIQDSLRAYIQQRRESNKARISWDVYEIVLNNVSVVLTDYDLGHIGVFNLETLTLPHVSSEYTKADNKDLIRKAITKEIFTQFTQDEVRGKYDTQALALLVARESGLKLTDSVREKASDWSEKAKNLFNNLKG